MCSEGFNMTKRTWTIAAVLMVIGTCTLLISRPVGFGFLLGASTAVLLYKRNESYWTSILNQGSATKWTGFFHFIINYALMAGVLLICALKQEYLNIFACAIGLFLIKITVTVDVLVNREGE
jgi:hypothetical protein